MFASTRHFEPMRGSILPFFFRRQPPFQRSWFSQSFGYPIPGFVSTLLNQAYSMPGLLVQTFLQVTEHVWHPMHLSRLSTMLICARTFIACLLPTSASLTGLPSSLAKREGRRAGEGGRV